MAQLLSDVRFALRGWSKAPGFTAIAVASIALGLGANTAIFTLVDQVLLRVLPVEKPRELVQVVPHGMFYGSTWGDGSELSYPMFLDIRDKSGVFASAFCTFNTDLHLSFNGQTERVLGEVVSGSYFSALGIGPEVGRVLTADDERLRGASPVAVLSHAFWRARFAANPAVVGTTLLVNGAAFEIVGVARAGFDGVELGETAQVFVPTSMKARVTPGTEGLDDRRYRWVRVFGRLRPGDSPGAAQAALQPFYHARLAEEVEEAAFANASAAVRARFLEGQIELVASAQGRSALRQRLTTPLWVLMAIAVGVLVIACVNVANLLIARGVSRQREMALRLALGASRWRLVRQLLVESLLLALAGGVFGLLVAAAGAPLLVGFFVNTESARPIAATPDLRILAFTFALSTLTGVFFGLGPALRASASPVGPALKEDGGAVAGGGQARFRKMLVGAQVAVSMLLLVGAALFIRTLDNLLAVDVGINPQRLVGFTVDPSLNGYEPERSTQIARTLLERLRAAPGVSAAGLSGQRILQGNQWSSRFAIEGYQPKPDENMIQLSNTISPGYFETLGTPLLAGRAFDDRDVRHGSVNEDTPAFRSVIVNERFAQQYFGDADPIGRRIGFGGDLSTRTTIEIVGVVRDAKYTDVRSDTQRQVFFPFFENTAPHQFTVYVRTASLPESMFQAIRATMREIDPNVPLYGLRTIEQQIARSVSNERLIATMSTLFGALAALLAVIGLYGVMAYSVARRTREIGIRMALGARAALIAWLVLREVLVIASLGMMAGLAGSWALTRYVAHQLFGVTAHDPAAIAAAAAVLALVVAAAGWIPSRRAASVDPAIALRNS